MDIAVVQAALSDFSTFVKNITELFQGFPEFIADFADFFEPATENDEPVLDKDGNELNNGAHWANQTSSIFE